MQNAYVEVHRATGSEQVPLAGDHLTVGRAANNDIPFPADDAVSSLHAVLERSSDAWQVRDLNSLNGTFVNGEPLAGARVLQRSDEIALGDSAIVFHPAESEPASAPAGYLDASEEWGARSPGQAAALPLAPIESAPVAPAPPSPPISAPGTAPRKRGRGVVRGVARNIQTRKGQDDREILALRVDRFDDSGNRLTPVAVEYRGYTGGQVSDGEEVEATGRWKHGTLRADKVRNLSTGADVRGSSRSVFIVQLVMFLLVVGFILVIAVSIAKDAL